MKHFNGHIVKPSHPTCILTAIMLACALTLSLFGPGSMPTPSAHAATTTFATQASSYKIVYKLNGGRQANNQITAIKKGKTIKVAKLKKPTRARYKFLGWYTNRALTTKATKLQGVANASKRTVYAKWKLTSYNIIYSMNGGLFSGKYAKAIGKGKTIKASKLAKPKRNGYTFAGWYTDKKFKTKATKLKGVADSSKRTVYAKWTTKTYTISYEPNGGTLPAKAAASYKTSKGCANLPTPTREGYSFLGWYADAQFTTLVPAIEAGDYGNKTLYAKWAKRIAIAHRGYYADGAAQNSISAYEAAAAKGFTHVETDVRFTKDNKAVLSHDATKKVYNKDSNGNATGEPFALTILEVTLDELQNNYVAVTPSGSEIKEEPPNNPSTPDSPGNASSPETPGTSEESGEPSVPKQPEIDVPGLPDVETIPNTPVSPEVETPNIPKLPDIEIPNIPQLPGIVTDTGTPNPSDAATEGSSASTPESSPSQTEADPSAADPTTNPNTDPAQPAQTTPHYRNISEFEEFLDTCKTLNLVPNIELKEGSQEQIESLVAAVDARGMTYSVRWASFQESLLKYVQTVHPRSSFVVLANKITDSKVRSARLLIASGGEASIGAQTSQLTDTLMAKCQKYAVPLGVWSLSSELKIADYPQYISSFTLNGLSAERVPDIL